MIAQTQLEIKDIFEDCQRFFEEDKPEFLRLLEEHIDLEALIYSFKSRSIRIKSGLHLQ